MNTQSKTTSQLIAELNEARQEIAQLKASIRNYQTTQTQQAHQTIILENISDAIIATDMNFIITAWNKAAEELYGWRAEEVIGKPLANVVKQQYPDDSREEVLAQFAQTGSYRGEVIQHHKDGSRLHIWGHVAMIKNPAGEAIGAVSVNRDITARKQAEKQLKAYAAELERTHLELQNFTYIASHDLQEPLRKVQAFGGRLRKIYADVLDQQGQDYLQRMLSASERMGTLIQDLLAFSRVTTKAQPFIKVDLNQIIETVLENWKERINQSKAQITVEALPVIDADKGQMIQLFQHLIDNSLKFRREEAAPRINIKSSVPENQSSHCQIIVTDNGIGFEEQFREQIFEVFQRLHGRNVYGGTGIGLAICRKIVNRHQGIIHAQSNPGYGATFIVTLPLKQ